MFTSNFFQVEKFKDGYDWKGEDDKYGPLPTSINRASDAPDSDLEKASEAIRNRKKWKTKTRRHLLDEPVGKDWLVRQRAIAMFEARRRPDWNSAEFNKRYPPYKFTFSNDDDYSNDQVW